MNEDVLTQGKFEGCQLGFVDTDELVFLVEPSRGEL